MMTEPAFIIGILAGTLTTVAFVPQVIKIYSTKNARDLSIVTFTVFSVGVMLWFVYGLLTRSYPVIIANLVTLILIAMIICMKIKYK
jgi:MtN3 and saliva related transmembrane protein